MIDLLLVALFQAAAGDPASAPDPSAEGAAQPAATETEQDSEEPRMVCRRGSEIGSRVTRRVTCVPAEEVENRRENDRRRWRNQSVQPQGNSGMGG